MMVTRINLSIDEKLMEHLRAEAEEKGITPNALVLSLLDERYKVERFDYAKALRILEGEALERKDGVAFTLKQLPSYKKLVSFAPDPYRVRARLGKLFYQRVAEGKAYGISRALDKDGKNKTICRAAAYVKGA
ncbi:MAG: hypothetical protein J5959_02485 [Butyrivibrio sp.]|nr:hypothetical protein [Butyrivibrio sp.]MBP3240175.1 hypothetical protein [Oribacterium sp.]